MTKTELEEKVAELEKQLAEKAGPTRPYNDAVAKIVNNCPLTKQRGTLCPVRHIK